MMSLKDDTVEINLYNVPNPHADGMIIGHVVGPSAARPTRRRSVMLCAKPTSPDRRAGGELEHFPSALNGEIPNPCRLGESGEIDSPGELIRCRGRIPWTCVSVRLKRLKAERRGER